MDKETLSNYGWIVICVLVLAVMIALATPFGNFIADAINSTKDGLFQTNQNALDIVLDDMGVLPSADKLQEKYTFTYFSSLNDAIEAVNDGVVAADSNVSKEDATAGVYTDENNVLNVVLLQDSTEEKMTITTDMIINLGGNTLTGTAGPVITVSTGDVYIDGRLNGSEIRVVVGDGVSARLVSINTGCTVTLDGGLYYNEGTNTTSAAIICKGTVIAQNIKLRNKAVNTSRLDGFSMSGGSKAVITNCDILSEVTDGKSYGIYVGQNCDITATNSSIKAYANYNHNGSSYTSSSMGIYHSKNSVLNLNDCHVTGTIAGVQTYGTLNVNGGIYEGYGHGGFYFVGKSTINHISNATIRECAMPEGYTNNNGSNHVGFYIGTGSSNSVYINNCKIQSSGDAIVMRGSSGDTIYISNTQIGEDQKIRIDSTSQKLFIGEGCNFNAEDTNLPDAVTQTSETYN